MAATIEKRIDTFYRNGNQFPVLTFFGIIMPVIMLFAVPLGWVYLYQKGKLLDDVARLRKLDELDELDPNDRGMSDGDKLRAIRGWGLRFVIPTVIAVVVGVPVLVMLLSR